MKYEGYPVLIENITASDTVKYSKSVIYPGELIRLHLTGGKGDVSFCREYIAMPEFGRVNGMGHGPEVVTDIWASDTEDAQLSNRIWATGEMTTTSQVILDKTKGNLAYSHVMEFKQDDQDDVIRTRLGVTRRYGDIAIAMPTEALMFSVNYKNSNDVKLMQVQIRRGPTGDYRYATLGAGWGAPVVWNDLGGSAVEVWIQLGAVTPEDADNDYTLALRPKEDAAAVKTYISHIGLHQQVDYGSGQAFLSDGEEYFFVAPYRCRVGVDMVAAGSGNLRIEKIIQKGC